MFPALATTNMIRESYNSRGTYIILYVGIARKCDHCSRSRFSFIIPQYMKLQPCFFWKLRFPWYGFLMANIDTDIFELKLLIANVLYIFMTIFMPEKNNKINKYMKFVPCFLQSFDLRVENPLKHYLDHYGTPKLITATRFMEILLRWLAAP